MATSEQAVAGAALPGRAERLEPWSFALFTRSPWRTATTAVILGVSLLFLLGLLEFLSGRPMQLLAGVSPEVAGCTYLLGDYRIGIVGVILLVYTATARYLFSRRTRETAALLGQADHFLDADSLARVRPWGFLPGTIGALLCLMFAVDISEREVEWNREYWILPHIVNWVWCIPFGWVAGRFFYCVAVNSVLISRLAKTISVRDLYDTAVVEASIRQGLQTSLLSLVFLGLVSVHFLDPGLRATTVAFLISLFVIGSGISVLPVMGAIRQLQARRDADLLRLRDELNRETARLLSSDETYLPGRVADIVALERRLDERDVIPFRASNIARLVLYAIVGLLSWMGAAAVAVVVEQLVGV